MTDYEKGYTDGVNELAEKLKTYYEVLGGRTIGYAVAYTVTEQAKKLTESTKGGRGYVLPSEEPK